MVMPLPAPEKTGQQQKHLAAANNKAFYPLQVQDRLSKHPVSPKFESVANPLTRPMGGVSTGWGTLGNGVHLNKSIGSIKEFVPMNQHFKNDASPIGATRSHKPIGVSDPFVNQQGSHMQNPLYGNIGDPPVPIAYNSTTQMGLNNYLQLTPPESIGGLSPKASPETSPRVEAPADSKRFSPNGLSTVVSNASVHGNKPRPVNDGDISNGFMKGMNEPNHPQVWKKSRYFNRDCSSPSQGKPLQAAHPAQSNAIFQQPPLGGGINAPPLGPGAVQIDPYIPNKDKVHNTPGLQQSTPSSYNSNGAFHMSSPNTTLSLDEKVRESNATNSLDLNGEVWQSRTPNGTVSAQEYLALRQWAYEMQKQAMAWQMQYRHAFERSMHYINAQNAENEQLRSIIKVLNPHALLNGVVHSSVDEHLQQELSMLFRSLACWAKKYYKFPTGQKISGPLELRMHQMCGDERCTEILMGSEETKFLVVTGLAMRYLVVDVFSDRLISEAVLAACGNHRCNVDEYIANARHEHIEDSAKAAYKPFTEHLEEAVQKITLESAVLFLETIQPLISRLGDPTHFEQTRKTFLPLAKQAARFKLDFILKRPHSTCTFIFQNYLDEFDTQTMVAANGFNLALSVPVDHPSQIAEEICGANVSLTLLPLVIENRLDQKVEKLLHKAYVLTV